MAEELGRSTPGHPRAALLTLGMLPAFSASGLASAARRRAPTIDLFCGASYLRLIRALVPTTLRAAFVSSGLALLTVGVAMLVPRSTAEAQIGWSRQLVGPRARLSLRSPEADARIAAAERLGARGEARRAVEALLEALDTEEDGRVRAAIFSALARRGDDSVVPYFAEHLADWGREDRAAALRTLGAIGTERGIPLLVEWLGAADVGDVAVRGLARVGAIAVPRLLRALELPGSASRAALALGRIGDARATAPLTRHLSTALPAVRIDLLSALAQIADERAAPAVQRLLSDGSPEVVGAALLTLSRVGGPAAAPDVARLADRGTTEQRVRALSTLNAIDPAAAAPRIHAALTEPETPAALRRAAVDTVLAAPTDSTIPALGVLLGQDASAAAAAEALARVGPAALPILLDAARQAPERRLDGALALGVARHRGALSAPVRDAAIRWLREDLSSRGETHAALAGDPEVLDRLRVRLGDADPLARAAAAWGIALLGDGGAPLGAMLLDSLRVEENPQAFRAIARAALTLGLRVDPAAIHNRMWDPQTAPEALELAATGLSDANRRTRRRVRRAMRRGLRAPRPRVRAAAAVALARAGDRGAWRALVAALDDEHEAVRRAVSHALAALAVPEARDAVAGRARVEAQPSIHDLLRRASGSAQRPPPAIAEGSDTLYLRVVAAPGLARRASDLEVDVILPDGRWLRVAALEDGAVFVAGLASGEAEVQVRLRQ